MRQVKNRRQKAVIDYRMEPAPVAGGHMLLVCRLACGHLRELPVTDEMLSQKLPKHLQCLVCKERRRVEMNLRKR